jgi:anti-sigma B factor antagonist
MPGPQDLVEKNPARGSRVYRVDQESIDATTAWDLRPELLRALYENGSELWIDLGKVSFIDSTGLGMLVGILKEARSLNGEVHLVNAGREVRRILQVTGLEAIFSQPAGASGATG